jgi:hypothetical protein
VCMCVCVCVCVCVRVLVLDHDSPTESACARGYSPMISEVSSTTG